jgi:RHS repeat-associated protein
MYPGKCRLAAGAVDMLSAGSASTVVPAAAGSASAATSGVVEEAAEAGTPAQGTPAQIFTTSVSPVSTYAYDADGNLVSSTLATSSPQETTSTVFNGLGYAVKTISPDGTYTTDQYDPAGNLIYSTDAMGRVTQYIYNNQNERVATINPDGTVVRDVFNGGGELVASFDAMGIESEYGYDKLGRKISDTEPNPAFPPSDETLSTTGGYDPTGDLAFTPTTAESQSVSGPDFTSPTVSSGYSTDPTGGSWAFSDSSGIAANGSSLDNPAAPSGGTQVAFIQPGGSFDESVTLSTGSYTIGFQAAGRVLDGTATFEVQVGGQTVGTFTPTATDHYLTYVANFSVSGSATVEFVGLSSSGAAPTSFITDVWITSGTAVSATVTTLYGYDSHNDLVYVTNAEGAGADDPNHSTDYSYNFLSEKTSETDAAPTAGATRPETTYTYDGDGDLTSVTDPRGATTSYFYDESGRKISEEQEPVPGTPADNLYTWFYYDNDGNLQYVVNPNGATSAAPPAFSSITNSADYTTEYIYDSLGRETEEIDPPSITGAQPTTLDYYNAAGNMVATVSPNGGVTASVYNVAGELVQTIDALGGTSTTVFDAVGNALYVTNALGQTTSYVYSAMNEKLASISPLPLGPGASISPLPPGEGQGEGSGAGGGTPWVALAGLTYPAIAASFLSQEETPSVRTITVPGVGQIVVSGGPITSWTYNNDGQVIQEEDPLGATSYTQYNTAGLAAAATNALATYPGESGYTTTTGYDQLGDVVSATDPLENTVTYVYNNLQQKTEEIDPAITVSSDDGTTTVTDFSPTTYYGYDLDGNLEYVTSPLGDVDADTTSGHAGAGDPGYTTWYFYDGLGHQTLVVNALADTSYLGDPDMTPTSSQPDNSTLTTYNPLGDVASVCQYISGSTFQTTTYAYNNLGEKTAEFDPAVASPSGWTEYNAATTWSSGDTAYNPTTTFSYNIDGDLLSTTDPDGDTSWTDYNLLNEPIKTVSADGAGPNDTHYATTTIYNAIGSPVSVTDPDGNVTTTLYNNVNQAVAKFSPQFYASFSVYDLDGDQVLSIDADGRAVQDVYNAVGEETQENWLSPLPPGEGEGEGLGAGYSVFHTINTYYDADGDMTGVIVTDTQNASNATDYAYTYSAVGNVLTSRMAPGDLVEGEDGSDVPSNSNPVPVALTDLTYTYYANGNTASVTDGSDISSFTGYTDFSYNALSQVVNEWQGVNTSGGSAITAEDKQANFTYNGAGQTATITTYGDGFDGEGGTEVAKGTYSYDAGGRLTGLGYTNASSDGIDAYGTTTPISYTVGYDPASNITSVASADGSDTLTLDNEDQLTSASLNTEGYAYDQNGNGVGGGYVTGADNLLLSDGTYNYQYDKNGNLVKRTNISTGVVTLYAWIYADELTQVTSRTGIGFGSYVTMTVTYAYDSFGNVIRETVTNYSSSGPTGPATTTYTVYNGANPYLTITDTNQLADGGATAAISQRDLYGQAVDQILATDACTGSSSGVLFGLADYQGTIGDVVNASGAEISGGHVKFNSFGLPTAGIDSLVADFLFGKAGMRYDPATGLYDDDARMYDPSTGKFESPDPSGMAGSGTNLEEYAGNSPVENEDPSGLDTMGYCPQSKYSAGLAFGTDPNTMINIGGPQPASSLPEMSSGLILGEDSPWFSSDSPLASPDELVLDEPSSQGNLFPSPDASSHNPTVQQFLMQQGFSPSGFPNLTQDALDTFLAKENEFVNKPNTSTFGNYGNSYDQTVDNYNDSNFDAFAYTRSQQSLFQRLQATYDDMDRLYRVGSYPYPLSAMLLQHWSEGSGQDIILSSSDTQSVFDTQAVGKAFNSQQAVFLDTLASFDALRTGSNELDQTASGDGFSISFAKPTSLFDSSNDAQAFYAFHNLDYASLEFNGTVQSTPGVNTWTGTVTFSFNDGYEFQPRPTHHPIPGLSVTDYDFWVPQQLGLASRFTTRGTYTFRVTYRVLQK